MFSLFSTVFRSKDGVISNEKPVKEKIETASRIIKELQNDIEEFTSEGSGPFVAAIYDSDGNFVAKCANSVVSDNCSNHHAELNVIRAVQEKFNTYDLSKYNLKIYITAEPCMMCTGGILASGIKEVYFGVSSVKVEKITKFDEGFKPNWLTELKKRGITVYGNIESKSGEEKLRKYVQEGRIIYKPARCVK